jgi:hypothetical protein
MDVRRAKTTSVGVAAVPDLSRGVVALDPQPIHRAPNQIFRSDGAGSLPPTQAPQWQVVDGALLDRIIKAAIENPKASDERVWFAVALATRDAGGPPPTAIPDPDLFRAIVAVARRHGESNGDSRSILNEALLEPLHVEPALLNFIVDAARNSVKGRNFDDAGVRRDLSEAEVWVVAWNKRVDTGFTPWPTPPDARLLRDLIDSARVRPYKEPNDVLGMAHLLHFQRAPDSSGIWPRDVQREYLKWLVYFALTYPTALIEGVQTAALYMVKYAGGTYPPKPVPSPNLTRAICVMARRLDGGDPVDILHAAMATQLYLDVSELTQDWHGDDVESEFLSSIINSARRIANIKRAARPCEHQSHNSRGACRWSGLHDVDAETRDEIWNAALEDRSKQEDLFWPPWPRPDTPLLEKIIETATKYGPGDLTLPGWEYLYKTPEQILGGADYLLGRTPSAFKLPPLNTLPYEPPPNLVPYDPGLTTYAFGEIAVGELVLPAAVTIPGGIVISAFIICELIPVCAAFLCEKVFGGCGGSTPDPGPNPPLVPPGTPNGCSGCGGGGGIGTGGTGGTGGGTKEGMKGTTSDPCGDPCDLNCSLPCSDPATAGCPRCPPPGPTPTPPDCKTNLTAPGCPKPTGSKGPGGEVVITAGCNGITITGGTIGQRTNNPGNMTRGDALGIGLYPYDVEDPVTHEIKHYDYVIFPDPATGFQALMNLLRKPCPDDPPRPHNPACYGNRTIRQVFYGVGNPPVQGYAPAAAGNRPALYLDAVVQIMQLPDKDGSVTKVSDLSDEALALLAWIIAVQEGFFEKRKNPVQTRSSNLCP